MNQTQSNIGVTGLLFVALVILKAMGLIGMSWFWVITSIVWMPILLILGLMLFTALVTLGGLGVAYLIDRFSK